PHRLRRPADHADGPERQPLRAAARLDGETRTRPHRLARPRPASTRPLDPEHPGPPEPRRRQSPRLEHDPPLPLRAADELEQGLLLPLAGGEGAANTGVSSPPTPALPRWRGGARPRACSALSLSAPRRGPARDGAPTAWPRSGSARRRGAAGSCDSGTRPGWGGSGK